VSDQAVSGFDIDSTGLGVVRSAWRWLMGGFKASTNQVEHARRFSGLDGLRALSVVAVLCYHALPQLPNAGFLGVDVFFMLSGFLITSLVIDQVEQHRFSLANFWDRRLRRILPAVVVMILGISLVVIWLDPGIMHGLRRQVLGSLTFSYNWLDISASTSYFDQFQPELFRNLWSLAVEMQFYLVWPLLLVPLLRLVRRTATAVVIWLGAGVSVFFAAWLFHPGADPTRVYFGTDTHAFGLLLGAGLACLLATMPRWRMRDAVTPSKRVNGLLLLAGTAAIGGIVLAICLLNDANPFVYPWGLLGASGLACVAVLAASVNGSWFGRALDVAPLRWVGERSYGVYLWHWPVAVIVAAAVPWPQAASPMTRDLITLAASLTLSIGLAAASYWLVETPIRQRGWLALFKRWGATLKTRLPAVVKMVVLGASLAGLVACLVVAPAKSDTQLLVEQGEQTAGQQLGAPDSPAGPHQLIWPPLWTRWPPPRPMPPGSEIYAIGDSVMLGCSDVLKQQFPGIKIDAKVSRSFIAGLGILQNMAQSKGLRPVVIFGLFTNGVVDDAGLNRLLSAVGPGTTLVLVTGHADRRWIPPTNKAVRLFVSQHPQNVLLADWDVAIKPYSKWLAGDGIHPNIPGRDVYVQTILDALHHKFRG